jgi:hypothetical protein
MTSSGLVLLSSASVPSARSAKLVPPPLKPTAPEPLTSRSSAWPPALKIMSGS